MCMCRIAYSNPSRKSPFSRSQRPSRTGRRRPPGLCDGRCFRAPETLAPRPPASGLLLYVSVRAGEWGSTEIHFSQSPHAAASTPPGKSRVPRPTATRPPTARAAGAVCANTTLAAGATPRTAKSVSSAFLISSRLQKTPAAPGCTTSSGTLYFVAATPRNSARRSRAAWAASACSAAGARPRFLSSRAVSCRPN